MIIAGIRFEFILFATTLAGIAIFHRHTLAIAISGLAAILTLRFLSPEFSAVEHLRHELPLLTNLVGLLLGFELLAIYFRRSRIPDVLPDWLPDDWKGGLVLLVIVMLLSAFLDNIAAAVIGGTMAKVLFQSRVHLGFLAAIVAASNAGGAGSVLGDTTTTMIWIAGVPALHVLEAFVGSLVAFLVFGVVASRQQHALQPITKDAPKDARIEWSYVAIVLLILVAAAIANVTYDFPALGVWFAILLASLFRKGEWAALSAAVPGALFLSALVLCASLMPVEDLPPASLAVTFVLGLVSSVFDNIPLTKLALDQGGYDWGFLAYAVGYGGSMIWFGSSAGVALSTLYPETRSVGRWLREGWHVAVGYIVGFAAMICFVGWRP